MFSFSMFAEEAAVLPPFFLNAERMFTTKEPLLSPKPSSYVYSLPFGEILLSGKYFVTKMHDFYLLLSGCCVVA